MNLHSILAGLLLGVANGAAQGIQAQSEGTVNWQSVGIVALFGGLVGLTQTLQKHPAVAALPVITSPQPAPAV